MIYSVNNINFGEKIPTEQFLKTTLNLQTFEDAKYFIQYTQGVKASGKYGFHQRAVHFSEQILNKNPWLKEIVDNIKRQNLSKDEQLNVISEEVKKLGKIIDVGV